jgi:hypothetical protein
MGQKFRLQIDFSEEAFRELENLQSQLDASSKSEVIRDALGSLKWAVDAIRSECRILVEDPKTGRIKEIVFHFGQSPHRR